MKKTVILLGLATSLLFGNSGAKLTEAKCASCHLLTDPTASMMGNFSAPPMNAVMFHTKMAISDKKELKEFILDYVITPSASKAVCESNNVEKFGVMPSQKGKVSKKDLATISDYIIENYPTAKFVSMITNMQKNNKIKSLSNSPFLINSQGLPHITKILIQNWNKEKLGLDSEQREQLLMVRDDTMSAVAQIKKELSVVESEILEEIVDGATPESLYSLVDDVAKLKAKATKVHLNCISQSVEILSDEQVELLLPFW